ncbi:MAG: HNH endonuclease [Bacillota bacterium]
MGYKEIFMMPNPVKITGRTSSITNSFVNGIVPCITPSEEEIQKALSILGMLKETICCAYCGDQYTEWDHFRPIVRDKRATGYISEIHNLVPTCGKCNQSKGNSDWKEWMTGAAIRSPATRGIKDLNQRIQRLEAFEKWAGVIKIDFEQVVGKDRWEKYWDNCELLHGQMRQSQILSDEIRSVIQVHVSKSVSMEYTNKNVSSVYDHAYSLSTSNKVGAIVQTTFRTLLESGKVNSYKILQLQQKNYCKQFFDVSFPILIKITDPMRDKKAGVDSTGINRYYIKPLKIGNEWFLLTSQWFDRSKTRLQNWMEQNR